MEEKTALQQVQDFQNNPADKKIYERGHTDLVFALCLAVNELRAIKKALVEGPQAQGFAQLVHEYHELMTTPTGSPHLCRAVFLKILSQLEPEDRAKWEEWNSRYTAEQIERAQRPEG